MFKRSEFFLIKRLCVIIPILNLRNNIIITYEILSALEIVFHYTFAIKRYLNRLEEKTYINYY